MKHFLLFAATFWLLSQHAAGAAGFQQSAAPDPGHDPLPLAIWYPSDRPTQDANLVAFDMSVATNAPVPAGAHPLIVMSHGTGGMEFNSYDTAIALADAGFIVVAVRHTGDNYRDRSTSFSRQEWIDRPRHISRVIDFMLNTWPGHASVDAARIGIFGHSAGGTTSLLIAGGIANLSRIVEFCSTNPEEWSCQQSRQHPHPAAEDMSAPVAGPDTRVKAVVLVAPAISVIFQPDGLTDVKVPVQLWVGEKDDIVPDASRLRTLLPAQPDYHIITNGGHFAYLTPCNEILERAAPDICANPPGFDRTLFLQDFHKSVITFYQDKLK
jgi:predicted dienelactone hydrolase